MQYQTPCGISAGEASISSWVAMHNPTKHGASLATIRGAEEQKNNRMFESVCE